MNDMMLIVSTISSLLAGVTAVAGELRVRRGKPHRSRCTAMRAGDPRP
jgi:hypothetical protein